VQFYVRTDVVDTGRRYGPVESFLMMIEITILNDSIVVARDARLGFQKLYETPWNRILMDTLDLRRGNVPGCLLYRRLLEVLNFDISVR
jgi:hypothetical protein